MLKRRWALPFPPRLHPVSTPRSPIEGATDRGQVRDRCDFWCLDLEFWGQACKATLLNSLERQIDKALEEIPSKEWVCKGRANVRRKTARVVTQQISLGLLPHRSVFAGIRI